MEPEIKQNSSVSKTLRHEIIHLVVTGLLAVLLFVLYRNIVASGMVFFFGMLLDVDHLLDYFLYLEKYKKPFSLEEFLSGSYFPVWQKFITPLHAWEIVIASVAVFFDTASVYSLAIAVALASHYLVDYFTNDVNRVAYFFLYRLKNRFNKSAIKK